MKRFPVFLLVVSLLIPATGVYAQEENPWPEVFLPDGNLNPDLIDLGITTDHPDWMSIDLPFGQSLDLEANYHRYQTPNGNIVVLPSAATLFFMAMSPQESGLASSYGALGNGYGSLISILGLVAGDHLNWNRVQADHPEYANPDQFWGAVLNGQQDVWTYFSGWGFITTLMQMTWNDAALRSMYLLYLNDSKTCASTPGGCLEVVPPPPLPTVICPEPSITIQQPTLFIQKTAPNHPLVVGQDPERRRGADIQASVNIPPVIFTWHEPIYEEQEICRGANPGESPNCNTGSGSGVRDGVSDTERVFKECLTHIEHLPDAVASLQATAALDAASQAWITGKLGQTHYEAYVHQVHFNLIPGLGFWSGGCSGGTCTAIGQALRVPFADPGTFNLHVDVVTTGTHFRGVSITPPRHLETDGTLQVYVTLPALVP